MSDIISDKTAPKPKFIALGVPTFGTVSIYWHIQTTDMLTVGKPMNRAIMHRIVKGSRVDEARNIIVKSAFQQAEDFGGELSHVFFLDDDVLITRDTLIRLLSWEVPIVSGLYFGKSDDPQPLLFFEKYGGCAADWPINSLVSCYAHGMGCTLIQADVFKAVEYPWFKTEEGHFRTDTEFESHTEDTYFLERAAEKGFTPHVDTGLVALHYDRFKDRGFPVPLWEKFKKGESWGFVGPEEVRNG